MNDLFWACKHGKAVAVKRLVIENTYTPEEFGKAAELAGPHKEIVKYLFEYCPDAVCTEATLVNAINKHVFEIDIDFVKLLICHGGRVSFSVLLTAAVREHNKLVSALLKWQKWSVGDLSKAFEYAAMNNSIEMMDELLRAGAVPCAQALTNAICANHYYVVVYLLDLGLRPTFEDFVAVKDERIERAMRTRE